MERAWVRIAKEMNEALARLLEGSGARHRTEEHF
jgi:hypothetical protein